MLILITLPRRGLLSGFTMILFAMLLGGCSALRPHSPPPENVEAQVRLPGMPNVRMWGDQFSPEFQKDMIESVRQEQQSGLFREGDTVSVLAISVA